MTDQRIVNLQGAIKVLDEQGWCRNYLEDSKGRHCAMGAIREVDPYHYEDTEVAVARYLQRSLLQPRGWIAEWNDKRVRDKREVIRTFRKVIKAIENGGL